MSNKFITFDVVTSDLARQVYPGLEGLMMGMILFLKFLVIYVQWQPKNMDPGLMAIRT